MKLKTYIGFAILASFLVITLVACGGDSSSLLTPSMVVESYITALVEKDSVSLSTLSCADWEPDALMELDSLQAVEVRLDALNCTDTGNDGEFILVNCTGNIIATYNGEDQNIDLSNRNYKVIDRDNEILVCGYQ